MDIKNQKTFKKLTGLQSLIKFSKKLLNKKKKFFKLPLKKFY